MLARLDTFSEARLERFYRLSPVQVYTQGDEAIYHIIIWSIIISIEVMSMEEIDEVSGIDFICTGAQRAWSWMVANPLRALGGATSAFGTYNYWESYYD
ncbi:MAG: hypothetical protein V3U88_08335 [Methylococcales bacterium]